MILQKKIHCTSCEIVKSEGPSRVFHAVIPEKIFFYFFSGSEGEPPIKMKREKAKVQKEVQAARVEFYQSAIEALKCRTNTSIVELTEEESFGKMVAQTLTRFNARQRAIARKRINDALYEVEIGDIENNPAHTMFPGHFSAFYNHNRTSFNHGQSSDHYTC